MATVLPFTPRTTARVAAFFDRLDARLTEYGDPGYAGAFLGQQIDRWEELARQQAAWAARGGTGPDPVGGDAFEVGATLAGLYARQHKLRADAAARVAKWEQQQPTAAPVPAPASPAVPEWLRRLRSALPGMTITEVV